MEYKKSAIDLTDLALGILVLGIVVTIGATILVGMRDSRLDELSTFTTYNETITGSNSTASDLTNTWVKSVDTVYNATDGTVVGSGNYTLSVSSVDGTGSVLVNGATYNGESLNVTYTSYNTNRSDWSLAIIASLGLYEYGNWFKIIVIVGVSAVILALIFMAFGRGQCSVGQSY